ncbi:HISTIDINE TRIAD NUCLEOTIDE-BINDING 2 [Raphanus sativus]|uniref:14 kDa zinc-binding protein n=1 Tax=Raphanus sativus TaxID=3726 RepID=A0A6J0NU18_RAPSA|nr:14 kDa zinc-binding protein [Raphanus sativus]KAJ4894913.1 HISTIDINE TRIAD NUCLEOTIDE-BINDING 2 [Raphanus sativus]
MAATSSSVMLLRNFSTVGRIAQSVRSNSRIFSTTGELIRALPRIASQRTISSTRAAHNEEAAAKSASDTGAPTIFDKIIAKEIPSDIVYEDESVLAFKDINPQAPVHVLVIPKLRDGLTTLGKAEPRHVEVLGQLLHASKIVAEKEGIVDGFRVVINNGAEGCQSVYHLHLHVLGGRQMKWPPG